MNIDGAIIAFEINDIFERAFFKLFVKRKLEILLIVLNTLVGLPKVSDESILIQWLRDESKWLDFK